MFGLTSKKRLDEALELVASLQKQVGELTVELRGDQENGISNEVLERALNTLSARIKVYRDHSIARDPKTGKIMNKAKSAEFFAAAIQAEYRKQGLL